MPICAHRPQRLFWTRPEASAARRAESAGEERTLGVVRSESERPLVGGARLSDPAFAAKQVGAKGRVIGVDMTQEMLAKARENAAKVGADNVEFRLGEIEHLPIADNTADVILSNCVINLVPDKAQVFREAFRVLKPGGRLAISDMVNIAPLSPELAADPTLACRCVSGAAPPNQIEAWLADAGFTGIRVAVKPESRDFIATWSPGRDIESYVASAVIEGCKPTS